MPPFSAVAKFNYQSKSKMNSRFFFAGLTIAAVASILIPSGLVAADRQHDKTTFTWNPELSKEGPVLVAVSLKSQRAAVYRNGIKIGMWKTLKAESEQNLKDKYMNYSYRKAQMFDGMSDTSLLKQQ